MSLEVLVQNARNVPKEKEGKGDLSDPFVQIIFRGKKQQTETKKNEENPEYSKNLKFDLKGKDFEPGDFIQVQIWDWEMLGSNQLLCEQKVQGIYNFPTAQGRAVAVTMKAPGGSGPDPVVNMTVKVNHISAPGGGGTEAGGAESGVGDADTQDEEVEDEEDDEGDEDGDVGVKSQFDGGTGGACTAARIISIHEFH